MQVAIAIYRDPYTFYITKEVTNEGRPLQMPLTINNNGNS